MNEKERNEKRRKRERERREKRRIRRANRCNGNHGSPVVVSTNRAKRRGGKREEIESQERNETKRNEEKKKRDKDLEISAGSRAVFSPRVPTSRLIADAENWSHRSGIGSSRSRPLRINLGKSSINDCRRLITRDSSFREKKKYVRRGDCSASSLHILWGGIFFDTAVLGKVTGALEFDELDVGTMISTQRCDTIL